MSDDSACPAATHSAAELVPFPVFNRWSGKLQFTAMIEPGLGLGFQIGDAVRWAIGRSDANLRGSDLRDADLRDSDLRDADLRDSDLRDSDLRGSDLRDSNLRGIKADFLSEVLRLPNELEALRDALIAGRIDGSSYAGDCACLAGTLAKARGNQAYQGADIQAGSVSFHADIFSPREQWFLNIKPGDTPETSQVCAIALDWTNEAIAIRDNIRGVAPAA